VFDIIMIVCDKLGVSKEAVDRVIKYKPTTSRFIVLNNGSKDGIQDYLRQLAGEKHIELVQTDTRIGAPSGRNILLTHCNTEFVLSIDDDVWVDEGWWKDEWEVINKYPRCAIVAPCGGRISRIRDRWTPVGYNSANSPIGAEPIPNFRDQSSNCEKGRLIDSVPTMQVMMRLSAIREVGCFDTRFDPFLAEDADLCFALWEKGWECRIARSALSHYAGGGQSHEMTQQKLGRSVATISQEHMELLYEKWEKKWSDAHKVNGRDFYPDEITEWEYKYGKHHTVGDVIWFDNLGYGYLPRSGDFSYDGSYFQHYVDLEKDGKGLELSKLRMQYVNRFAKDYQVVDVGIGAGTFIKTRNGHFGHAVTWGCDVSREGIEWLNANELNFSFERTRCLVATFWDSLEHTLDANQYLMHISSLAIISMPIYPDETCVLTSKHFKPNEHIYYFTKDGLIRFMDKFGFNHMDTSNFETEFGRKGIMSFCFNRVRP